MNCGKLAALACAALAPAWAHGGSAAAVPTRKAVTHSVSIENMQFQPSQVTVHAGDWLVFSNKDLFPHTVSALDRTFDSQAIAPGASWR